MGKRIEDVFVALFFQLLAPESLILRRDRRKWSSVPDRKPEERSSLQISERFFFQKAGSAGSP